ncbi:hypothetical protein ACHAXT_003208 [Thalassiosira profunda]
MEHPPHPAEGPAFGVVNAESITDAIEACHVSIEESRLRLAPLLKVLDADDGGVEHDGGHTDGQAVREFADCVERVFGAVDELMARLADGGLVHPPGGRRDAPQNCSNGEEASVYLLMASNCIAKASDFIGHHCLTLLEADSLEGPGPLDDRDLVGGEGGEMDIQPCMARLAELALRTLLIHATLNPSTNTSGEDDEEIVPSDVIDAYAQYQRRCLRARSKPAISSVAELRRVASGQKCFVSDILDAERRRQQMEVTLDEGGDENDEDADDDNGAAASRGQPHAQAITVILGETSRLMQPLAAWKNALSPQPEPNDIDDDVGSLLRQMCQESMEILDNEAQTLAVTIGSWFGPDQRGVSTLDNDNGNSNTDATKSDLASIEASLEEMAFLCQVISRYCLFSEQTLAQGAANDGTAAGDSKLQNLLTEQSLHYSTLETRLAALQFGQAVSLASPQLIELGRPALKVPSIVEDAHFICCRAIERASGTRSERAVWTVGHWVCEGWGVDSGGTAMDENQGIKGVYSALLHGVGCTGGEKADDDENDRSREEVAIASPPKSGNAFAAALMEAVDDSPDRDGATGGSRPESGRKSAPTSGGLFFGRGDHTQSLQSRIDAELCALNGISAAANACSALSALFSDLVEEKLQEEPADAVNGEAQTESSSMLTFARDELASHSRAYHNLLHQRVRALVTDLCGGDDIFDCDGRLCLQNLRLFVEKECYDLDSASFREMEGEDRLETEMIGPVRRSQIFEEVGNGKCDAAVVLQMAEAMSWKSAEIVLQVLLQGRTAFNEWGAMLLSKQIRLLQNVYCGLVLDSENGSKSGTASILTQFERVNQAVSILQLEKPSDWLAFAYKGGESDETSLTADEIQTLMGLRVDFSEEAIARVCMQLPETAAPT